MSAVFSHGRLRLYLLRLLADGPKHGYELIRSLENRFHGLYAPSAGTIYPRLARLEADGLVTHTASGGRKVYSITDAGRAELAARASEVAQLEAEISSSVADLAELAEQQHRIEVARTALEHGRNCPASEPMKCCRFWSIIEGHLQGLSLEESHARAH